MIGHRSAARFASQFVISDASHPTAPGEIRSGGGSSPRRRIRKIVGRLTPRRSATSRGRRMRSAGAPLADERSCVCIQYAGTAKYTSYAFKFFLGGFCVASSRAMAPITDGSFSA